MMLLYVNHNFGFGFNWQYWMLSIIVRTIFQMYNQIKELVDKYNNEVLIEQLSICGWSLQNKLMAFIIPRHLNGSIATMKEMKKKHPEMTELLDKRIGQLLHRRKLLEKPQTNLNEALNLMQDLLNQLESNLSQTEFICGPVYTFADCLFTILLARLKMLDVINENLKKRPSLAHWWEKVQRRQSYQKAGIIDTPHRVSRILINACSIMWFVWLWHVDFYEIKKM